MVAVALWWEWRDEEEEEAAINQRQGREEVKKTERLLDRGRGRGRQLRRDAAPRGGEVA
jgi:hypothetical protein